MRLGKDGSSARAEAKARRAAAPGEERAEQSGKPRAALARLRAMGEVSQKSGERVFFKVLERDFRETLLEISKT